jgi:hypothetical protein
MIPYKDLFVALAQNQIRYLVAGGFAVNLHQIQRATMDLDLIVHLEKVNLLRFAEVMKNLGFIPRLPVKAEDFADPEIRSRWITEKNMMVFSFNNPKNPFEVVDVFVEEPSPFEQLFRNKIEVQAFQVKIDVIGVEDLIEMKKKAGRDKDLFDIEQLKKKLKK